jgi:transcriptional regulator with XRE-family HTH domain
VTTAGLDPITTGSTPASDAGPARSNQRSIERVSPADRARLVELGATMMRIRIARDVSLDELAEVAGSPSSLAQIERGAVRTRASRLRPWLERVGATPAEIDALLARYADVIAAEPRDGRPRFQPRPVQPKPEPTLRTLASAPLEPHQRAALGARLWRARVDARLERSELAAAIGCRAFSVWLIEHGLRRPTAELLERWLSASGSRLTVSYLELMHPGYLAHRRSRSVGRRPRINPSTHQRPSAAQEGDQ